MGQDSKDCDCETYNGAIRHLVDLDIAAVAAVIRRAGGAARKAGVRIQREAHEHGERDEYVHG